MAAIDQIKNRKAIIDYTYLPIILTASSGLNSKIYILQHHPGMNLQTKHHSNRQKSS
jgi:hypothetical protein